MNNRSELYTSLEFDKILSILRQYTLSPMANEKIDRIEPSGQFATIDAALKEVAELKEILQYDDAFPLVELFDIRKDLEIAAVEGNFLNSDALVRVALTARTGVRVRSFLSNRSERYPQLWDHAKHLHNFASIDEAIKSAIDFQTFEIEDSASPKLKRIRKDISQMEGRARKAVEKEFKNYAQKGYLQEDVITFRDGRLVLPVKWEYKGSARGLIHGQSAKGLTIFLEPFEAVELNNEILRLKGEETREIERILRELTQLIRDALEGMNQNLSILAHLDFIQARAKFSQQFDCHTPQLNQKNFLEIIAGRHPLLMLRKNGAETTVPLDLKIGEPFHTLIITGPNTGGKTVAIKTVGLFALMVQSGVPIPAHPDSKMPIFESIFADIGDLQSIEQDLSTFSSHVQRIRNILENARERSLVLIDEIGAGTDPEEGAALAMAILEELNQKGCRTVVTTHLGVLKAFAHNTPGIENGSMEFDMESLQPKYRLRLGIPGSSYAIEIAKRLGIGDRVLSQSRQLLGKEQQKLEQLLLDLEDNIQKYNKLRSELDTEKTRLSGLSKLYQERYETIKREEKNLKKQALENSQEILNRANAAVEQAIREIREKQAEHHAIKHAKQILREEHGKIAQAYREAQTETEQESELPPAKLEVGEEVFWKNHNARGTIVSEPDAAGKCLIEIGNFKFKVPTEELFQPKTRAKNKKPSGNVNVEVESKSDIIPEIDLRGQTVDEAIVEIDKFLDDATLAGWHEVRIIHGKGTGALRKGISQFLESHPRVKKKRWGAWNEGDIGVTVVELT